jgi:hypothetical protein
VRHDAQQPSRSAEEQPGPAIAPSRILPRPSAAKRLAGHLRGDKLPDGSQSCAAQQSWATLSGITTASWRSTRAQRWHPAASGGQPTALGIVPGEGGGCCRRWPQGWRRRPTARWQPGCTRRSRCWCVCVHRASERARVRASSLAQDKGRASVVLVACLALMVNACACACACHSVSTARKSSRPLDSALRCGRGPSFPFMRAARTRSNTTPTPQVSFCKGMERLARTARGVTPTSCVSA